MALVLIQHLAPQHHSALTELLSRATRTPVAEVKDGVVVERDRIYVIPPNTNMAIREGRLVLVPRPPDHKHLPIDYFLRSMAEELGNRAIGVILSGTASDGTLGLEAIKAEGGITFAQEPNSAKYGDMPRNAMASGCVDFVLPPEGIARELLRIAHHPYLLEAGNLDEGGELAEGAEHELQKVFTLLRAATGVDFTHYKHTTIKRRIKRRMVLHKLQEIGDYVTYIEANRQELDALYADILIHVTSFFRDPQAFEALKMRVFPALMKRPRPPVPVRIWVPGCATGEEAYSVAICLLEFLGDAAAGTEIQIFATDISDAALEKARAGIYPENIAAEVSSDRLRRFFVKTPRGYQIAKSIRDILVFARQDLTKDPPFSRMDLISCRNLLIYMGSVLQKRIIPIFHYALKPTGFLLLGGSETIGAFGDHFALVDKKNKIYSKKPTVIQPPASFARSAFGFGRPLPRRGPPDLGDSFDVQKEAERVLLDRFAPAGVIVNSDLQILHFRGHTGSYLEPAAGQASLNLSKMAREGLLVDLRDSLQKAAKGGLPVRKEKVSIRSDSGLREIDIEVVPLRGPSEAERYFLVLFENGAAAVRPAAEPAESGETKSGGGRARNAAATEIRQLKQELGHAKSTLESVIAQQDTTTEELKSANEEILSSNEELQSTNEELETAKEELQSSNEELTTVNEELQNRNLELSVANNDLLNLLASMNIPILMLGSDLRIRRFTPQAETLLNLIASDVGRPFSDIKPKFNLPGMEELIVESIDSVSVKELEVQDRQGRWYSMRIRPYRTAENKLDGAVITWVDVSRLKTALQQTEERFRLLVDTVQDYAILMLDPAGRVTSWNAGAQRITGYAASEIIGQNFSRFFTEEEIRAGEPQRELEVARREERVEQEGWRLRSDGSRFWANAVVTALHDSAGKLLGFTKILRDVTEKMEAQRRLQESEESLRELSLSLLRIQDEERRRIGRDLHDSVGQYLSALKLKLDLLHEAKSHGPERLARDVDECVRLADESLKELRTVSHLLYPPMLDEMGLSQSVQWYVAGFQDRSGIKMALELDERFPRLPQETELAVYRVLQESLTNVHRHSGSETASVRLAVRDGAAVLEVRDQGQGSPDRPADPSKWGVGLRSMHERVRQLGGTLAMESSEKGTTVTVAVPIQARRAAS
jgi:two-component system CheB/CheR fusion protein